MAAADIDSLASFACRLAEAARQETLGRWAAPEAEDKGGGAYDPVTQADFAAERAMRELIERHHPDHGISGEEYGSRRGTSPYSWSLDPIDGTRSYLCGLPAWVTLIALMKDGIPIIGLIDVPRLGERYLGYHGEARVIGGDGDHILKTSECSRLADARFSTTDPYLFTGGERAAFERLREGVKVTRYGYDGYAYARLAAGTIDLIAESGLKPHDIDALVPIVRGAGGVIGNWRGGADLSVGQILAAATQDLFEEAVARLSSALD